MAGLKAMRGLRTQLRVGADALEKGQVIRPLALQLQPRGEPLLQL